jgi:hypothetical protein
VSNGSGAGSSSRGDRLGSGAEDVVVNYDEWSETCDTLHAHTQVLGKLAVALAPPEPQLQHAALRLTARGWETAPLPAPDGSGAVVVALDLRTHEVLVEHSGRPHRAVPLTPNRSVGEVTIGVVGAVADVAGPVTINTAPQEVPWDTPLDEDGDHRTYDPEQVGRYFAAATEAALGLSSVVAPYRGRRTPVNAWWGSFDLAVNLFSGRAVEPSGSDFITRNSSDAETIAVGWWPGDARHPGAACFGYALPAPAGYGAGAVVPPPARWDAELGEFILEWDDAVAAPDPRRAVVEFGRSVIAHSTAVCGWEPALAGSAEGVPPPVV